MYKVLSTNHAFYFSIAKQKLKDAEELDSLLEKDNSIAYLERYKDINLKQSAIIISIIFSALASEAFVNYYMHSILKEWEDKEWKCRRNEIRKEIENELGIQYASETVAKCFKAPEMLSGVNRKLNFKDHSLAFRDFQTLFSRRNNLVHFKAVKEKGEKGKEKEFKDLSEVMSYLAPELLEHEEPRTAKDSLFYREVTTSMARESIDSVIKITKILEEVDSNVDSTWLEDSCTPN
ncbi:MAG: hypothetical protein VKK04_10855 [Synechococcales bacterium]|nr:hypothetical protein [Synechococcales bacterium]